MAYQPQGIDRTARLPDLPDLDIPDYLTQDPQFQEIYTVLQDKFSVLSNYHEDSQRAINDEVMRLSRRINEMIISGAAPPDQPAGDAVFYDTTNNTLQFYVGGTAYDIVVANVSGALIQDSDVATNAAIETYKFNLNKHDVHGTFASDTPANGSIQWNSAYINYDGIQYSITNGSTSSEYIWWDISSPTSFQTCTTRPTLSDINNDFLVARNDGGTFTGYFNQSEIDGRQIRYQTTDTDAIENEAISERVAVSDTSTTLLNLGVHTILTSNIALDVTNIDTVIATGTASVALNSGYSATAFFRIRENDESGTVVANSIYQLVNDTNDTSALPLPVTGGVDVSAETGNMTFVFTGFINAGTNGQIASNWATFAGIGLKK